MSMESSHKNANRCVEAVCTHICELLENVVNSFAHNYVKIVLIFFCVNLLKTKRRVLYLKTQFVPRSKHFDLEF